MGYPLYQDPAQLNPLRRKFDAQTRQLIEYAYTIADQGRESIHDFHGIDQYIDFNPRQRQSTKPVIM